MWLLHAVILQVYYQSIVKDEHFFVNSQKNILLCSWPDSLNRIEMQDVNFPLFMYLFCDSSLCYCSKFKTIITLGLSFITEILDQTTYCKFIP